jgi:hypothetical protein
VQYFVEWEALGKDSICQVSVFADCQALGTEVFAECFAFPSAALGKFGLCRVRNIWHSANSFALGKDRVSCSE